MKKRLVTLALSGLMVIGMTLTSSPVEAKRRGRLAPPHRHRGGPPKDDKDKGKGSGQQGRCDRMKRILDSKERRLQDLLGESAGVNTEYEVMKRRLDELKRQRDRLNQQIAKYESVIKRDKAKWKKSCEKDTNCDQYEMFVKRLEARIRPIEDSLTRIRDEISKTRDEIANLERQIPPIQREYMQLKCRDLIPGETAQSTIDRCSQLFSDWNRLQIQLNGMRDRIAQLQGRYANRARQLASLQAPLNEYSAYLDRNCKDSTAAKVVRDIKAREQTYRGIKDKLEDAAKRLQKLKGIRIHVEKK